MSMEWTHFDRGVFLVNVLGIVRDSQSGKVLIGRREFDPYLRQLSWSFPGGRPAYDDELEHYLRHEVAIKTGFDVSVQKILFAKTYPEKREFLSIYYLCEVVGGVERAGEKFTETKWVAPNELQDYFTTSLHPQLVSLMREL
jgi:8-oxo-dGTP diphosphatase